jgi:hypothetical protein
MAGFDTMRNLLQNIYGKETQPSHRIFEKSAGTICLALPHSRDE